MPGIPNYGYMPALGSWSLPQTSASSSATFGRIVQPPDSNIGTLLYLTPNVQNYAPSLLTTPTQGIIHVTKAEFTVTGAADLIALLAPLNYTNTAADGTATTTTSASITLSADPGVYSTNYRNLAGSSASTSLNNIPTPPNAIAVSVNAIAAGDWICFQAADGTWYSDVVAAVAGSTTINVGLTNGMPSSKAGSLVYFFGIAADKDPATNMIRPQLTPASSSARASWTDTGGLGIANTLFNGDPLLILCKNTDSSMVLNSATGYYAPR